MDVRPQECIADKADPRPAPGSFLHSPGPPWLLLLLAVLCFLLPSADAASGEVPVYGVGIIRAYPHDPDAFTQGLAFEAGVLYEGTGLYGESSIRKVHLETGRIQQIHRMPPEYFGEGIAVIRDRIVQLTWQSRKGFVYDKKTLRPLGTFGYATEGWGITFDGKNLIMSDGTATLRFLDPVTFAVVRSVTVHDDRRPVAFLNELEFIGREIYANIWGEDRIARISPRNGAITGWIDLSVLRTALGNDRRAEALNGIAYDRRGGRLFVTGKYWPKLFEIRVTAKEKKLRR